MENRMVKVNKWLENDENELENLGYMEKSDETFNEKDDDFDERLKAKYTYLKALHPKNLFGNCLYGCFIHRLDPF